jgi:DNA polymerase
VLPDAAIMGARSAARAAQSLLELETTLAGFDGCPLKATAKNLCFYRGATKSALMLIGEAPGRDEDLAGKPFVGRAGQLLDKMLAAIGLTEEDVHITNIVYWRPPGNRTPTPQEAQVCRPFLERQIELVAPKVIALLGGAAAKHLLDVAEGIMRIRGKPRALVMGTHDAQAMATLHPAYLLRTPAAKRLAWRDLLAIKALLEG